MRYQILHSILLKLTQILLKHRYFFSISVYAMKTMYSETSFLKIQATFFNISESNEVTLSKILLKICKIYCKIILQRQTTVPLNQARDLARRLNATYVETSAKTCNHLKEAFDEAITTALQRRQRNHRKWWTKLCCWK